MELTIEQALQQGVTAHKAGKLQDAERLYRAILQSQPTHPDANHKLGVLAVSVNKADAALPLFKTALEANPKIEQFWLSYVDALIKTEKVDDARQAIADAKQAGIATAKLQIFEVQLQSELSPSSDIPQQEFGNQLQSHQDELSPAIELREVGKYKEAQEWLSNVIEHDSRNTEALSLLSQVLLLDKKEAEAEKALTVAASINSELPSVYRNQARLLLKQSKTAEALKKAQLGCRQSPEDSESLLVLAACLGANQRDLEALPLIEKILKDDVDYAEAYANRALIKLRAKDTTGAIEDAVMTVSLKPHLTQIWRLLSSLHYQANNLSDAIEALRGAHKNEPENPDFMVQLGEYLRQDNKASEAINILEQATELAPKDANTWTNLGVAFQQEKRIADAKIAYEKALALNPKSAAIMSNLGAMAKEAGELESALQYFEKALEIEPNLAEAQSNLGNTLKELGRLEDALASYTQAIALKPDLAEAHRNLGNTLQELGRLDEATNIYHQMLTTKSEYVSSATKSPVIALLPFGRAGSLFFHSLLDGHPEIATLPGVYFKGWFGIDQWRRFAPDLDKLDWREHLIAKVVKEYQPFFDARFKNNVAGTPLGNTKWLAKAQGFTNMGPDRSQTFVVDQKSFSDTFLFLLKPFSSIGIQECFELIHRAFEISARGNKGTSSQKSSNIFYHIHNPDPYEYAHFLKHYPQARLLQIIRNPVQSMESWMLCDHSANLGGDDETQKDRKHVQSILHWTSMVKKIVIMCNQLQSPFNAQTHSRGVRLEDVKRNAHDVMPKIAAWIGIPDHPAIYESSFCGFQYWGPSSKETGKITGFDTKAIDLPIGRLLGSRDILIFETLFWPLSYQYGYTQLETAEFRRQLMEIRPWLAEPLEFERRLYDDLFDHSCVLEKLAPYIRLHDLLSRLWETLYQDGTYPNMVKPLELED